MYTWMRTATYHDGQRRAAIEWALKANAYVKEKFAINTSVQVNVAGQVNQIHWIATFATLAEFENTTDLIVADSGYQQLLADSYEQGIFLASSNDRLLRAIG